MINIIFYIIEINPVKLLVMFISKPGFTYILSNYTRTVLYIGVTNNIYSRLQAHKNQAGSSFAIKYKCYYLMWYESFLYFDEAIVREKQLKRWHKKWKWNLIKIYNPQLLDLSAEWFNESNQLIKSELLWDHIARFY